MPKGKTTSIFAIMLCAVLDSFGAPSAAGALNMFLAHYSAENISWQREIRQEPGSVEEAAARTVPPRKTGVSAFAGAYSYRPATWDELTPEERSSVLDDPRLKPWLEWFCRKQEISVPARIGTPLGEAAPPLLLESGLPKTDNRIPTGGLPE